MYEFPKLKFKKYVKYNVGPYLGLCIQITYYIP